MKTINTTRDKVIILSMAEQWVQLMERELYKEAYDFTTHDNNGWSPESIGRVIKSYGDCVPTQKITLVGTSNELSQRKNIVFINDPDDQRIGSIWYDLNIDGRTTDLTATFDIIDDGTHLWLQLNDIHVM